MMNQEKIQELVSRSQQDDKRAFALLVSEFQPLVFRLAFRLLCDEEEARDITQETFVKVWLSLKTYNQKNRLSTWLYKITCNTCYDRLRSLRHSPLDNESAFSDSVNIPSDDHIEISLSKAVERTDIAIYQRTVSPAESRFHASGCRRVGGSRSTDYHRIIARKDKKYLVPCQKEHT